MTYGKEDTNEIDGISTASGRPLAGEYDHDTYRQMATGHYFVDGSAGPAGHVDRPWRADEVPMYPPNSVRTPDGIKPAVGPAVDKRSLAGVTYSEPTRKVRSRVLETAEKLINGDREQEYGTPQVNFQRIADIWQVQFPERKWTPADVALALVGVKLARAIQSPKEDTFIDLAGYTALAAELS